MPKLLYVVDSDLEFARHVAALLSTEDLEVAIVASAEEFLETLDPERVACVLVDSRLPGTTSVQFLHSLRDRAPGVPVLITSAIGSASMASSALEAGASDFLQKPFDARAVEGMLDAIRGAINAPVRASRLTPVPMSTPVEIMRERFGRLTQRELEIARLVALGHSSKSIAASLRLSRRTVDNHRAHILEKLQLDNFVQVARSLASVQSAS